MTTFAAELDSTQHTAADRGSDLQLVPAERSAEHGCDDSCPYCWGPETD